MREVFLSIGLQVEFWDTHNNHIKKHMPSISKVYVKIVRLEALNGSVGVDITVVEKLSDNCTIFTVRSSLQRQ